MNFASTLRHPRSFHVPVSPRPRDPWLSGPLSLRASNLPASSPLANRSTVQLVPALALALAPALALLSPLARLTRAPHFRLQLLQQRPRGPVNRHAAG